MNRRRSDKAKRHAKINAAASELFGRQRREFLIDGYNLLHVTRFKPVGNSDGELRGCREGLLQLLAKELAAGRFPRVTVVFDATNVPAGLPCEYQWQHLLVLFAKEENSADDLIVKLIEQSETPQELVVVSSDHRVQLAASRRGALGIDSDVWFDGLLDWQAREPIPAAEPEREKPVSLSSDDTAEFKAAMNQSLEPEPGDGKKAEPSNPFPEGFFDDLEREFPDEFN